MRYLLLFALLVTFACGCSKKKEPVEPAPEPEPNTKKNPGGDTAKDRAYWFNALKSKNLKDRDEAATELVAWVATDPETVAALLELLRDKTTNGPGKTIPRQINSTRHLAVDILKRSGAPGQAALKDKGLAILREGLSDPDPAVREHTLFAIEQLGSMANSLSPDILKLCGSPDTNIHNRAFDALAAVGVNDPVALSDLMSSENSHIVSLTASLLARQSKLPPETVKNLILGLGRKSPGTRISSANAIAHVGPEAAPAIEALVKAINEFYPKEIDPTKYYETGSEMAYWRALTAIGEAAVVPTADFFKHTNPFVRGHAAQTLGEIGPPSKAVVDKLKAALKDEYSDVSVEAACTLCRLDEGKDEAVDLVKRMMDAPGRSAQYAIEAIPRLGDAGKPLIPIACGKITSENVFARYAAVVVISSLDREEAAKFAAELGKLVVDTATDSMNDMEQRAAKMLRQRAITVLGGLGAAASPAAESIAKVIANEKDSGIKDQLTDVLLAMGPGAKPAASTLLTIAENTSTEANRRGRVFYTLVLAVPGSKEVFAALLKAADENDTLVRVMSAAIMATLDPMPPEALTKLVQMANTDRATAVRAAALRALAVAGPRAKPVRADLEKIAGGGIPEFALAAKVALAAMDGNLAGVAADVRAALGDKNSQVRSAAVDGLLLIGPNESDIPALQKLLGDRSDPVRESAAKCVARLGPAGKEAVPQLIRLLDDKEGSVRIAAALALGEIGPAAKEAVEKLRQMRGGSGRGEFGDPIAGGAASYALMKIQGGGQGPGPGKGRPKKDKK